MTPKNSAPYPSNPGPAIEARQLCKQYGTFTAVKGIDFAVQPQECFGFLGPNGAGKTSTMKMLYGVCSITSGELYVLGQDLQSQTRTVKCNLGVVPQESNLDEDLSVLENLLVYARYFGLGWKATRPRAEDLLNQLQLQDKINHSVQALSGGMKRRLLIARALIASPKILILDEPTVGLDPQARHLLWDILRDLRKQGLTLLLTTHYMDEAEKLCDRLVIMHEGSIIAEGSPPSLIAEHVGGEVLEMELAPELDNTVLDCLGAQVNSYERAQDRLLLYSINAEALLQHLREADVPLSHATLRRATLEDVFLKLTGRELREG